MHLQQICDWFLGHGKRRSKPTPGEEEIARNMGRLAESWNGVSHDGSPVLNETVQKEMDTLTVKHINKGCLSDIPTGAGTERNEELHK